jgi:hypothetical protein
LFFAGEQSDDDEDDDDDDDEASEEWEEEEEQEAVEGDGDNDEEPAFMRSQVLRLLFGGGGRGRCDCLFVVLCEVGAKLSGICTPLVMC